ncbi:homeobox protein Hox-A3 isoform X3 [Lathamus discolor]|uniref:homeobox protein Hox-A3 isoform X3 n=1 Tax=Lathamus discolor TaxID=678569 RepID=UPI0032B7CB49
MAISSSPAGRCGILDSKHWRGRFSTCNLANFLLLLAPKGGRFVSCAAKATAVKVAGAPVSQNLKAVLKGILLEKSVKTQRIFLEKKKKKMVVMCRATASWLSAKKMYTLLLEIEPPAAKYPMADYHRLRRARPKALEVEVCQSFKERPNHLGVNSGAAENDTPVTSGAPKKSRWSGALETGSAPAQFRAAGGGLPGEAIGGRVPRDRGVPMLFSEGVKTLSVCEINIGKQRNAKSDLLRQLCNLRCLPLPRSKWFHL